MRYLFISAAFIIAILILLPGCITLDSQARIDTLTAKINDLQHQVEQKISSARAGDLTTGEALEFIHYAEDQLKDTRDELRAIKEKENVGWTEIIGAIIASTLGTTGVIRAWRGPTHKTSLSPVT